MAEAKEEGKREGEEEVNDGLGHSVACRQQKQHPSASLSFVFFLPLYFFSFPSLFPLFLSLPLFLSFLPFLLLLLGFLARLIIDLGLIVLGGFQRIVSFFSFLFSKFVSESSPGAFAYFATISLFFFLFFEGVCVCVSVCVCVLGRRRGRDVSVTCISGRKMLLKSEMPGAFLINWTRVPIRADRRRTRLINVRFSVEIVLMRRMGEEGAGGRGEGGREGARGGGGGGGGGRRRGRGGGRG